MLGFLHQIIEILLSTIKEIGYLGIFIGMALESSFFPFPSEAILIPAGVLVARQEMTFSFVFLAALSGSLIGALINFFLALFLGRAVIDLLISKYKRVFFITHARLEKSDSYFKKYGEIATFIGRLIPVVRQLISLPAGFSRMDLFKFCLFTLLGAGLWALILIYIGYFFGNNSTWLNENLNMVTLIILLFSLIILIISILRKKSCK